MFYKDVCICRRLVNSNIHEDGTHIRVIGVSNKPGPVVDFYFGTSKLDVYMDTCILKPVCSVSLCTTIRGSTFSLKGFQILFHFLTFPTFLCSMLIQAVIESWVIIIVCKDF